MPSQDRRCFTCSTEKWQNLTPPTFLASYSEEIHVTDYALPFFDPFYNCATFQEHLPTLVLQTWAKNCRGQHSTPVFQRHYWGFTWIQVIMFHLFWGILKHCLPSEMKSTKVQPPGELCMHGTTNWWAGFCPYSWYPASSSQRVCHGLATVVDSIYGSRYMLWLLVPSRYTERADAVEVSLC